MTALTATAAVLFGAAVVGIVGAALDTIRRDT